jgi:hypothetical protein
MKFARQEFTQRVDRLEKLLEQDFGTLAGAVRKGGNHYPDAHHRQKLVEQLQYHDIIRQKIQHVGQFAEVLELEFSQYGLQQGEVCVLPGLLELSMALLQFARLEYDEVRQEIKIQLLALSLGCYQHEEQYEQFQQEMQDMVRSLGRMYLLIESPEESSDAELGAEKLRKICQSFSMQTEREIFRSLFNEEILPQDLHAHEGESTDNIELF